MSKCHELETLIRRMKDDDDHDDGDADGNL